MFTHKYNAPLFRQEGGEGGAGVPPIVYDFDIEKVKASGLYVPKSEFETTISNYKKQIKDAENKGYTKLGEIFDKTSEEIATLTGIKRLQTEKDGKVELEQMTDYVKRALIAAKNADSSERENKIKEIFTNREKELVTKNQELEQSFVSLSYNNELQGAMSELLVGITDKAEYANNQKLVNALVLTEYPNKEYSKEYNRFIYKDNKGDVILNKIAEPISTNEILAEVAKILPQRQQTKTATPSSLGNSKNNNSKPVTLDDILAQLEKDGITISNPNFSKKLAEYKKNNGLT